MGQFCHNLIDIDDMFHLTDHILQRFYSGNQVINTIHDYSCKGYLAALESAMGKADYTPVNRGIPFRIDISKFYLLVKELELNLKAICHT